MLRIRLLEGLDELQHDDFIRRFTTTQQYQAGEVVTLKGDSGTALLIVLSGSVMIKLGTFEATFSPGDFLGELAFVDGKPRSARILAVEDGTRIAHLSREQMAVIQSGHPALAIQILWNINIAMAERMRRTNDAMMALSAKTQTSLARRFPWLARLLLGAQG